MAADLETHDEATVAAIDDGDTPTTALVQPAGSLAEVKRAFTAYQQVCAELLDDDDHQDIGSKRFRKRSAWRKLAVAFGVTYDIVDRTITRDDAGRVVEAEFTVRATAPNGRHADGWGSCASFERCCPPGCSRNHGWGDHCPAAQGEDCPGWTHFSHVNHDVPATAETRAKNRASADLFGMGEVSAEEVESTLRAPSPEHQQLLDELDTLLDTAEGAGVNVDREEARSFAANSPGHATNAVKRLRGLIEAATVDDDDGISPDREGTG